MDECLDHNSVDQDPVSPLSPAFAGSSFDSSGGGAFLSHSLPAYNLMHGPSLPTAFPQHHSTSSAQARHTSLYMNSHDSVFDQQRMNAAGPMNPGAMSFEELFSMYYAGTPPPTATTTTPTAGGFEGSMLSALISNQGQASSLSHINPTHLVPNESNRPFTSSKWAK